MKNIKAIIKILNPDKLYILIKLLKGLPGGPVVGNPPSSAEGLGFDPWLGS